MSFRAKYPGRCPDCGDPIEVGDTLVATQDGLAVHEEDVRRSASELSREVCPRCFTEKAVNGACACDPEDDGASDSA